MTDLIKKAFDALFGPIANNMVNDVFGSKEIGKIVSFLLFTGDSSVWGNKLNAVYWDVIQTVYDVVKPLGFALMTTYFIISLIELSSKDNTSLEHFVKEVIKLMVAVALINNGVNIINTILSLGESSLQIVNGKILGNFAGKDGDTLYDSIRNETGSAISVIMAMLLPYIAHQLVVIALGFAAFSRLIEIGWRAAFMPVGMANMFEGGLSSPGVKYIKNFVVAVFSGVVILVVTNIGFSLCDTIIAMNTSVWDKVTNGTNDFSILTLGLMCVAMQFATVGAAVAASAKAKEVIGA